MKTMSLLHEALQDGRSGRGSSKRFNTVIATIGMTAAVVILAIGGMNGHDVAIAISGVAASLSAMCGANYVGAKYVEGRNSPAASGADLMSANHATGISKEL